MRTPQIAAILIAALVTASRVCAADSVHYVELVNTARDSLSSFAVAAAGSGDFRVIPLRGAALQGGGDSTTIRIAGDGCLRDFRAEFADGRVLMQKGFDVCKYRSYHTGQYLRRREPATALVQQ
ncbi:MAG: hypothetical protein ABI843_05965 [Dokdonella sp.]